jgi:monofunctional biosynthetic peptidoglycan transglycosylase
VWIELLWPKERILEVYLNVAEFGRGTFGVGAAAEHLLGKGPEALNEHDAALLVAVLPSPKRMDVRNPSAYVRTRTGDIIASVQRLGGVAYLRE